MRRRFCNSFNRVPGTTAFGDAVHFSTNDNENGPKIVIGAPLRKLERKLVFVRLCKGNGNICYTCFIEMDWKNDWI